MNMSLKGMMKSLNVKPGQVVSDPYARAFAAPLKEAEGQDHEVSMAKGSLEAIVKHATELMGKLGNEEKDIPGWIQDHIAKSENFIQQANDQYHEYGKNESVNEAAADTYVVYIMDGIGKKKVREIADKNSAIQMVKKLMTSPKIEGAGWMSASAWQKEPFRVS